MAKVWLPRPFEDWITDRFIGEFSVDNADIVTQSITDANVIWLLASWVWKHVPPCMLSSKRVLTTVHHVVPAKFKQQQLDDFMARDAITDAYHVPNFRTEEFVKQLTTKPVVCISYWANQHIWRKTGMKEELRQKHGIPSDAYVVGSFQRDTEGTDLKTPKLEKGVDLLCDYLERLHASRGDVHVLLGGWRRQYIVARLEAARIPYSYFERPSQEVVNELYQCCSLTPCTSRYEGGPQSLIESGLLGIPVVSRPVGIAEIVLPSSAIADNVWDATPAVPNVDMLQLPAGYLPYRKLLLSL